QNFLLDAVGKVSVLSIAAQVSEWENSDAFLRSSQRRSLAITGKHCDTRNDYRKRQQRRGRRHPAQTRPAFVHGLKSLRQLGIAELIVIEVHDRDAHAMLRIACAEIVQERSPPLVFFEIFGDVFG